MRIDILSSVEDINPDNDNIDVALSLDDGRVYTFLVATPTNIYSCMDNEKIDYFFGTPPLFVRRLTRENIERAVLALLEAPDWLDVYGTRQTNPGS